MRSAALSPTVPPPGPAGLASALRRNLDALDRRRGEEAAHTPLPDKVADAVRRYAGSMTFVFIHMVIFGLWVPVNLGLVPGVRPFDPTFVILGTTASCEAIFLSTFVLISQNRMSAADDRRADLDLQISLLSEHEITKLVRLVAQVADHLGIDTSRDAELREVAQDVAPEAVMDEIERSAASRSSASAVLRST